MVRVGGTGSQWLVLKLGSMTVQLCMFKQVTQPLDVVRNISLILGRISSEVFVERIKVNFCYVPGAKYVLDNFQIQEKQKKKEVKEIEKEGM